MKNTPLSLMLKFAVPSSIMLGSTILGSMMLTLAVLLAGCAATTTQQPQVIERIPADKKADTGKPVTKRTAGEKDWRPDNYIVKKGDTLYSVGLEFGFDYKEIAQHNNIQPPYVIRVGQQLKLPKSAEVAPASPTVETGAVVTPLKTEPAASAKSLGEPPTLTEPKALKEPYSEQAMAAAKAAENAQKTPSAKPATPEKTVEKPNEKITEKPVEKAASTQKSEVAKTETPAEKNVAQASDDEAVEWAWPVNGKTLTSFSDSASAKGIDIGGIAGQPVFAAAPGKVVYSGSGLRGYGKLIIIKHNKTYLSAYAHNNQILVKEGQEITKGQKIAEMGNTDTDRVKLHFEIRRLGKPVDPAKYLPTAG